MLEMIQKAPKETGVNVYKCLACQNTLQLTKAFAKAAKACYYCYPVSTEPFKVWLKANIPNAVLHKGEVKGRLQIVTIKFSKCGHTWDTNPNRLHKRLAQLREGYVERACPGCQNEVSRSKLSATLKSAHENGELAFTAPKFAAASEYVTELKGRSIRLCKPYPTNIKSETPYKHECKTCSHVFEARPSNVLKGTNCPKCAGTMKKTTYEYSAELKALGSVFRPAEEYVGSRTPIKHKTTCCDFTHVVSPTNMLKPKYHSRCPNCEGSTARNKAYRIGRRVVKVEGFEPYGLDYILKEKNVKASDVAVQSEGSVPSIEYKYQGWHKHLPDMYVKSENRLVEIKSLATLGIANKNVGRIPQTRHMWYKQVAKRKAAIAGGFKYTLLVFAADGERIRLPRDWHLLSHREIISSLKARYPHLL